MSAKWDQALADLRGAVAGVQNPSAAVESALDSAADQVAELTSALRDAISPPAPPA